MRPIRPAVTPASTTSPPTRAPTAPGRSATGPGRGRLRSRASRCSDERRAGDLRGRDAADGHDRHPQPLGRHLPADTPVVVYRLDGTRVTAHVGAALEQDSRSAAAASASASNGLNLGTVAMSSRRRCIGGSSRSGLRNVRPRRPQLRVRGHRQRSVRQRRLPARAGLERRAASLGCRSRPRRPRRQRPGRTRRAERPLLGHAVRMVDGARHRDHRKRT